MSKITPFLWFDTQAEEAMNYYVSLFPNSKPLGTLAGPGGSVMGVTFELDGQRMMGLNGGPLFKFNEAISFYVECEDQAEVDRYYDRILADGGKQSQCGWIADKFGLWWQIIPKDLPKLLGSKDPKKSKAAMEAMLKMKKINIAEMQKAYDQA